MPCELTRNICMVATRLVDTHVGKGIRWGWTLLGDPSWGCQHLLARAGTVKGMC